MEPGHYGDPLEEALSHGSQRVAQLASLVGAMAQVVIQRRALHDARTAVRHDERATQILGEQERLLHHQARLTWSPAHDASWLARADLPQTGRAWGGAASHADTDPLAASAMRKCEDRLRTLHPHAMARYDRLRTDGLSPLDAMREAARLFSRSPDIRVGDPVPSRPELTASTGQRASRQDGQPPSALDEAAPDASLSSSAALRGREIIRRTRSSARANGLPDPGPDELALILESATNLPHDVIDSIIGQVTAEDRASSPPDRASAAPSPAGVGAAEHDHGRRPDAGRAGPRSAAQ